MQKQLAVNIRSVRPSDTIKNFSADVLCHVIVIVTLKFTANVLR